MVKQKKFKCETCQDCANCCTYDENCYDNEGFHILTGSYYRDDEDYVIMTSIEDNTEG